jgi:hypothetical protein
LVFIQFYGNLTVVKQAKTGESKVHLRTGHEGQDGAREL